MSFDVSADAYLRFMGQYSEPLAVRFADLAHVQSGQRLLDVGGGQRTSVGSRGGRPGRRLRRPGRPPLLPPAGERRGPAAAQGRGVGRRLLRLAEEHVRGLGRSEIRLYTNEAMTENLAYYPRRGYTETHRAEQDGFRRVFFRKPFT